MQKDSPHYKVALAGLYGFLDPIPIGFFFAAWLFDIIYVFSFNPLWTNTATWLITLGLFLSIIPRLIGLAYYLQRRSKPQFYSQDIAVHFWLTALAIVLSIVNAFVHSRDAYAVVPQGVQLSTAVVIILAIAYTKLAVGLYRQENT